MFALSTLTWTLHLHMLWKGIQMTFLHLELGTIESRRILVYEETIKRKYTTQIVFVIEVCQPTDLPSDRY